MKIKAAVYLFLIILLPGLAKAQVSISLQQPQPFQLKPADMFNAIITNGAQPVALYFVGTIVNTQNGQRTVSGKSAGIQVPAGTMMLSEPMLQPVYSYVSAVAQQTGQLPYGNYEICLKAFSVADNEERGDACLSVEYTPLSPPLLISPENGSEIHERYPLLTWLPPGPADKRHEVLYDLKLVELMGSQTAYDAVQRNFALLDQKDIRTTYLQYPMNATPLAENKTYAWKILAKSASGTVIGETEVWTFKLAGGVPAEPAVVLNNNYIIPKKEADVSAAFIGKEVKVFFDEDAPAKLTATVYDQKKRAYKIPEEAITAEGNGKFIIDLSKGTAISTDAYYTLEVKNRKQASRFIFFRYVNVN